MHSRRRPVMLLQGHLHGRVDGHRNVLDGLQDVRQEGGERRTTQERSLLVQLVKARKTKVKTSFLLPEASGVGEARFYLVLLLALKDNYTFHLLCCDRSGEVRDDPSQESIVC